MRNILIKTGYVFIIIGLVLSFSACHSNATKTTDTDSVDADVMKDYEDSGDYAEEDGDEEGDEIQEPKPVFVVTCDDMKISVIADGNGCYVIEKTYNSVDTLFYANDISHKKTYFKETSYSSYTDYRFAKDQYNYITFNVLSEYESEPEVKSAEISYINKDSSLADMTLSGCDIKQYYEGNYTYHDLKPEAIDVNTTDNIDNYVLTLKWKSVYADEYGLGYVFEDKNGKEYTFWRMASYVNEYGTYFEHYDSGESIFGSYKINDEAKDKWYWVNIVRSIEKSDELGGEMDSVETITDMQEVRI